MSFYNQKFINIFLFLIFLSFSVQADPHLEDADYLEFDQFSNRIHSLLENKDKHNYNKVLDDYVFQAIESKESLYLDNMFLAWDVMRHFRELHPNDISIALLAAELDGFFIEIDRRSAQTDAPISSGKEEVEAYSFEDREALDIEDFDADLDRVSLSCSDLFKGLIQKSINGFRGLIWG